MLETGAVLAALRSAEPRAVLVTQLGNTSGLLARISPDQRNFYLLGAMGNVIPFALGIAAGVAAPVIAIEGDGGALMGLGSLATAARYAPENLKILILDNEAYDSTGGQPSATASGVDLAGVAASCGSMPVASFDEGPADALVEFTLTSGFRVAVAKTTRSRSLSPSPSLDPHEIVVRVRASIQSDESATHTPRLRR
ncbi:thiamine pyrophosphate-dependent enzyme [Curtobacterium sp. Leaf154]|uniref:thiamine pyrophosphate-dependent enzyme n=1 Tax=Curtobacterium sp. Leaf154 TaxID=1736277 RepID=UPI0009EBB28F|nr:thiamine pyrophosphate-dependent enzyme [Curtobacterium sp. Leaf154]